MNAVHIRYGVTVHFVLYLRQQVECRTIGRKGDLPAGTGNGTGAVLLVFHHAEHRNVQPKAADYWCDRVHVSLSAVQQNQVRQSGKALLVLCQIVFQPSGQCFFHTSIVVLCDMLFHAKTFIGFFQRSAVFKYHHAADHRGGGEIGNVVGFDILRRLGNPSTAPVPPVPALPLPVRLKRIASSSLALLRESCTNWHSVPRWGTVICTRLPAKIGEQLLVHLRIGHSKFQNNIFGNLPPR